MYGLAFGPSLMILCFKSKSEDHARLIKDLVCAVLAVVIQLIQLSIVVVYTIIDANNNGAETEVGWSVPLSMILVSVRYWENYIGEDCMARLECMEGLRKRLVDLREKTRKWKVDNQLIANAWKIIFTLFMIPAFVGQHIDHKNDGPAINHTNKWSAVFRPNRQRRSATFNHNY